MYELSGRCVFHTCYVWTLMDRNPSLNVRHPIHVHAASRRQTVQLHLHLLHLHHHHFAISTTRSSSFFHYRLSKLPRFRLPWNPVPPQHHETTDRPLDKPTGLDQLSDLNDLLSIATEQRRASDREHHAHSSKHHPLPQTSQTQASNPPLTSPKSCPPW